MPAAKRAIDVLGASAALLALSPLLAIGAVLIRLDTPGPVLFRQKRVGRGGRPFEILKLRTMHADADEDLHQAHVAELIEAGRASGGTAPDEWRARGERGTGFNSGEGAPAVAGETRAWAKLEPDPRLTRSGRLLRATAIDELPQLINVLRGEMSLVGPRPALPYEVERYESWHLERLQVPPGITGPWQVEARGAVDFDEMVRLDIRYVRERSLATDLAILARTPLAVLRPRDGQA